MREKLRKVKDKLSKKRKDSVVDASRTNSDDSETVAQPSLLGLPAELRNEIYQYLAASTTLMLSPASPKKRPPPVGLLLACRQTWQEYRAILMTQATFMLIVANYNFSFIVRTFEKMNDLDLSLIRMNPRLNIYLQISHVPSRDDRNLLRAWRDYRSDAVHKPYFALGRKVPQDLVFEYDVVFLHHMRPPRPVIRYSNGYEMRLDLLRTHLRMATRILSEEEGVLSLELQKLRDDLGERETILKDLVEGRNSIYDIEPSTLPLTNQQSQESGV